MIELQSPISIFSSEVKHLNNETKALIESTDSLSVSFYPDNVNNPTFIDLLDSPDKDIHEKKPLHTKMNESLQAAGHLRMKMSSFEKMFKDAENEILRLKKENNKFIQDAIDMDSRYNCIEELVDDLKRENFILSECKSKMKISENKILDMEERHTKDISVKDKLIYDLEETIILIRNENQIKIQETIALNEREHINEYNKLIIQMDFANEQISSLKLQSQLAKEDKDIMLKKMSTVQNLCDDFSIKYNDAMKKLENLSSENICNQNEISRIKNEKLKNTEEYKKKSILFTNNTKKFNLHNQRYKLLEKKYRKLKSKCEEYKLKNINYQKNISEMKKVISEKQIDLDSAIENCKMTERYYKENTDLRIDVDELRNKITTKDKKLCELIKELELSRYDVSEMKEIISSLEVKVLDSDGYLQKKIKSLVSKIREMEKALEISHNKISSKNITQKKAHILSEQLLKEVTEKRNELDQLNNNYTKLKEKSEITIKNFISLRSDNEKISTSYKKIKIHNDHLHQTILSITKDNDIFKMRIIRLEEALEKIYSKYSNIHKELNLKSEDIIRIKNSNELQIKELLRNAVSNNTSLHNIRDNNIESYKTEQSIELKDILSDMKQIIIKEDNIKNISEKNISHEKINQYYDEKFIPEDTFENDPSLNCQQELSSVETKALCLRLGKKMQNINSLSSNLELENKSS